MKNPHSLRCVVQILILGLGGISANAQEIKPDLCKKFNEAADLYVLKNEADLQELTTTAGDVISFEKLVRQDWPDKNIILMEEKAYNKLDDVKDKFFITLSDFSIERDRGLYTSTSTITMVLLQEGKTGTDPKKTLAAIYLKLNEIEAGIVPERLAFAVASMKYQMSNPGSGERTKYSYKATDIKDQLDNNTLYIRKTDLTSRLQDEGAVRAIYHHPFKLVSDAEWAAAITGAQADIIYAEFMPGGEYAAIDVRNANTGRVVASSFPWIIRGNRLIEESFFKKVLE